MGKLKKTVSKTMGLDLLQDVYGKLVPDNPFEAPNMPAPEVMPEADSADVRRARKRSMLQQMGRSGRESTILTDTLG